MDDPFVSVVIVNYNGAHYLPACLDALHASTYPPDRFEVIVSDNASSDGSLDLLRERYPWVRVLANKENLGFASGNNVAIGAARGPCVVLLNNDTAPRPDWLANLVTVAESNPEAGMVTGRLQLYYDQLNITLEACGDDTSAANIQLLDIDSGTPGGVVQFLDGFEWTISQMGQPVRTIRTRALVGVPVPPGTGDWHLRLRLALRAPSPAGVRAAVCAAGIACTETVLFSTAPVDHCFTVPASTRSQAAPLVQNAGSIMFANGSSRDRGTYTKNNAVFYETDQEQYDRVEEVFSGCGANLLIRKSMLDMVGPFDDHFFMYYEDTDLAWRARLRGWKVLYAPQAIVRHVHCGTSKEWSPAFLLYTSRNRLAMLFKNARARVVVAEWVRFVFSILRYAGWAGAGFVLRRPGWHQHLHMAVTQSRALLNLIQWLPRLIAERRAIQKNRRITPLALERWFVH